jgi:hypothetical protein
LQGEKKMVRVELDAVVNEYAFRMISAVFPDSKKLFGLKDRKKDRILMTTLETMVASGVATHRYVVKREVDEFLCTKRLIRHWGWFFPGAQLSFDPSERQAIEISGSRSRYFKENWGAVDKNDPPPPWPD